MRAAQFAPLGRLLKQKPMATKTLKKSVVPFRTPKAYEILVKVQNNFTLIKLISENEGITVSGIVEVFKTDQSEISRKLRELQDIDFVFFKKDGRHHQYYLTEKALKIAKAINKFNDVKDKRKL